MLRPLSIIPLLFLMTGCAGVGHRADDLLARHPSWDPIVQPARYETAVAEASHPYKLDTGDRLRIFVYGQPSLSRLYTIDQSGRIAFPLIGAISARGQTTSGLQRIIAARLATEYVKDPQVTVDIYQNRPFFILGEVRTAGQFPFVSGMTVETAVAIAGGYTERASQDRFRVSRSKDGYVEQFEVPRTFILEPGDTVYVRERFL